MLCEKTQGFGSASQLYFSGMSLHTTSEVNRNVNRACYNPDPSKEDVNYIEEYADRLGIKKTPFLQSLLGVQLAVLRNGPMPEKIAGKKAPHPCLRICSCGNFTK